jgi:hypothetical protein
MHYAQVLWEGAISHMATCSGQTDSQEVRSGMAYATVLSDTSTGSIRQFHACQARRGQPGRPGCRAILVSPWLQVAGNTARFPPLTCRDPGLA